MRLAPSVAADLEEIFKEVDVAPGGGRVARSMGARAGSGPPRAGSGRRLASLGALAAAGLVGLSAGALLLKPEAADKSQPQPEPVRLAAAPTPPEQPKSGYPYSPEPFIPLAAEAAPAPQPEAEPASAEARPAPAKVRPEPEPKRSRAATPPPGSSGYANVMAADRRLRAAYDRASRAGVDRATLVSYRRKWDRMRRRDSDEPGRLISGYGALTVELNRLATDARHAARRSSSWS